MRRSVRVGNRKIGSGERCYLIVEVGTTHLGVLEHALDMVDAAASAGVDAVKFQAIDPEQVSDPTATYTFRSGGQSFTMPMKEMFERLAFSHEQWATIAAACRDRRVDFFATVDSVDGVDMLERLGVPAHKIGAWDGTFRPLIERLGRTGKPVFCDLGPTTQEELDQLAEWFVGSGGRELLFFHDFHTSDHAQMNLRAIRYLNDNYPWPAGFSAPGRDHDLDMAALGLGAHFVEKRLILSRSDRAFHADESLEPDELKDWVRRIRNLERALGEDAIRPSAEDRRQSRDYYRSVCTLRDVRAGEVFSPDNLGGKRPGTGLPTARLREFWGRRAARNLDRDMLLTLDDFSAEEVRVAEPADAA
jgi:sialic acid synthase SpsE